MKRRLTLALAFALALPLAASAEVATWNIDPNHSAAQFSVKHLVISTVRGQFGKTTGTVMIDDANLAKSACRRRST